MRIAGPPQRQDLNFSKAFFEVIDRESTHQALLESGAQELIEADPSRPEVEQWYLWQEPHSRDPQPAFSIRVRRSRLVLEGPTAQSVGRGWRSLERLLTPHAVARVAADDDLQRFLPRPRRHAGDRPESWSAEYEERVLRDFRAQLYQRWARTPHPQLDGHTPAEAQGDPALAHRLEELLERMEKIEEARRSRHLTSLSVASLRRTLVPEPPATAASRGEPSASGS